MATIGELIERGQLRSVRLNLSRYEFEERRFMASPVCHDWLFNDLKKLEPVHPLDISPRQQVYDLLKRFITGQKLARPRQFRLMRPLDDDVYELKTIDVRIYGWFQKSDVFIASHCDMMENTHSQLGLASAHQMQVVAFREALDLDEPKCLKGTPD